MTPSLDSTDDADEDRPAGWVQYDDGTWAAVGEDGTPGEPFMLDVGSLSESDVPEALVAAVTYIDPLDAHDHANAFDNDIAPQQFVTPTLEQLTELFEQMSAAGWGSPGSQEVQP
ncbi:hypothetical protein [Nocardia sp. NPDC005998]|uniref:hypothetical protein n=1 Tax=Nocardia sp. NPDC005998 TaxID=3156894 RepID=UPI0033A0E5C3